MPPTDTADIIVVGLGAAGLATAILTARRMAAPATNPQLQTTGLRILGLDGAPKLGAKILVSGGGRCNVTNVRVTPDDFCGGSRNAVRRVLAAFPEKKTAEFFSEIGVSLHEEQWGKLFPDSNSAKSVLSALLAECERLGVQLRTGHRVTDIRRIGDGLFAVTVNEPDPVTDRNLTGETPNIPAETFVAPRVVLATGGKSLPKTGSDGFGYELARRLGHTTIPQTPALAPLVLDGDFHRPLSGVSHEVEITIRLHGHKPIRITGPMLWTHFGASGPAAMDASRHWHRAILEGHAPRITLNFLPGEILDSLNQSNRQPPPPTRKPGELRTSVRADFPMATPAPPVIRHAMPAEQFLLDLCTRQPKSLVRNALSTVLPARLIDALASSAGIPSQRTSGALTRDERRRLLHALLEFPMPVVDSRGYTFAEATAGGVPLHEIDTATMASRVCPGLFLAGEILDVDGRIGGFNFQWAWSSAHVAAEGLARSIERQFPPT